jgi:hypothetical protein
MTEITAEKLRGSLIEFVRRDLVGPSHGENETIDDPPKLRYTAGILFPQGSVRNESAAVSGVEEVEDKDVPTMAQVDDAPLLSEETESLPATGQARGHEEGTDEDIITLANTYRPSAIGLTFMVDGASSILISARAAVYAGTEATSEDGQRVYRNWIRQPLELKSVSASLANPKSDFELTAALALRVVSRPQPEGCYLVTVSLFNTSHQHERAARTFFQTMFSVTCDPVSPCFVEYHSPAAKFADEESVALAMLYRNRKIFAVGHGCAADWAGPDLNRKTEVRTQDIPAVQLPPIVPLEGQDPCFSMEFLADEARSAEALSKELYEFCDRYATWIEQQIALSENVPRVFQPAATKNLELCQLALKRMRSGVSMLEENADALRSFRLANRAMLMQQVNSRRRRRLADPWHSSNQTEYQSNPESGVGYWRAFQLAFLLITIPSTISAAEILILPGGETVNSRELVDLIWFPTGGGKTEAYLGLTAFVIFLSRLKKDTEVGCKVLMRYTLRLLTSQQFQRAASLICACEHIRRLDERDLGATPITIGLWVGQSLTPNDEKDALAKLAALARNKEGAKNPFQLLSCPWCGTELSNREHLGYREYRGRQVFVCPAPECDFSRLGRQLPVCVVDETLYASPSTLIIGTVDKFAMLAWRESAGALLKVGGGPELIIQDELHLISGPLGSLVGLYESVIDYLCSIGGRRPKIVASTATIRRADEQCRALYNRPMLQFPPPSLDASDSFFAREDRGASGRIYLGFLPTAASSPLTAQIRSVVALLQGLLISAGADAGEKAMDPYWTLVQYFGSLKELGRAATFITADIPEFLPTAHRRYGLEGGSRRFLHTSEELTSRRTEDEIPKILKRLETPFSRDAKWDGQALDTVLATNMISVGVDVMRLGLMMVVTQPKSTSEYIQASSRVGRSSKAPGLILTLYNAGRPRDRSHYEHFRAYHEAFYRFVEPTSVTPFSPPALERALHGVLAIAGRHVALWKTPKEFDHADTRFRSFLNYLTARVKSIDPDHLLDFERLLQKRLDEWELRMPDKWGDFGRNMDERVLLWPAGVPVPPDFSDTWPTPTSLRNVDVECSVAVVPHYSVAIGIGK